MIIYAVGTTVKKEDAINIIPNKGENFTRLVRDYNEDIFEKTGRQPLAFVRTFGCQQNVSDSEKLKGMLFAMGYAMAQGPETADLILFNTCAVRENAEERVLGNVGALKSLKESNRGLITGLCGCMMQQPHIAAKVHAHYPYVDLIFGTHALGRFPELLWRRLGGDKRIVDLEEACSDPLREDIPVSREGNIGAWVPVMYGCDNFCTYCVVPFVRGRERSRELCVILDEVKGLVEKGFKEIHLLGQNVNSYGRTLEPGVSFSELLRRINAIPGDFRIRFMTSHPKDCTHELIDTIAECEKVCRHIHLPVQSGSDRILSAMNRRYTAEKYLSLIDYARGKIKGVAFTSDIIVGFPGETDADFAETLSLIERVRYHSLYTFIYSKREGTKAALMEDPATREDKRRRFDMLTQIQRRIGQDIYDSLVGTTCRVLAEGPGKTGQGMLAGRTEQGVIVEFEGDEALVGRFAEVSVTKAMLWAVAGKAVTGGSLF
ncbi:MAG: tRNA (N6-isopentenyl adenosine(37)-C2)-methylthiotransferase MiaB [Oscillospiraceae bacterium]|jgi:tRNA-2-methylthio-N6-dimethylallyladenosine synthase|nr:tRNA (N6-isopentenyl adenosine(37)-C2)-methylthiotransferase MiaB [Oscillospiraceae bacterium]